MNILVIGATRGIGLNLVEQASEQGHAVTVLVRNPSRLQMQSDLRIIGGDILESESVERAITGQDAVVVTIGIPPTRKPVSVFSSGIRHVIEAMDKADVKRLITVTGIGAGDSRGHGGFFYDRILNPLLLATIYQDKDRQEALVRASGLDWTIVRPGFLTNGPLTGAYRVLTDMTGVRCGRISRRDSAHFILADLETGNFLHQTPLITR